MSGATRLRFVRPYLTAAVSALILAVGGHLHSQDRPQQGGNQAPAHHSGEQTVGGQVAVSPDYLEVPPIAQRVTLMPAQGDEAGTLLRVEFTDAWRRRLGRSLDVQLGEQSVTLRDDGQGGDEKADDGLFSTRVPGDFKELQGDLQQLTNEANERQDAPVFEGRVKVNRRRPARELVRDEQGVLTLEGLLPPPPIAPALKASHSLMITHLGVVEDPRRTSDPCTGAGTPMGKWTFGYLMKEMANTGTTGIDPSIFVRRWLRHWEFNQTVNFFSVPARPSIRDVIIRPWEAASGGPGRPLDLSKAPFRLLAIVNRLDLRDNFAYSGGTSPRTRSAGEARFVFCAVDMTRPDCPPLDPGFTVIFEYGIKKKNCHDLQGWAKQWAHLSTLALGSPAYNAALEAITEQFVRAGADPEKLPNKSALNQLRTNEIALGLRMTPPAPWELREFRIDNASAIGHLQQVTVKLTPDNTLNGTPQLADCINMLGMADCPNLEPIDADCPPGFPFLGGASLVFPQLGPPDGFFWNAPAISMPPSDRRFCFSFNTCNGCHGGETFGELGSLDGAGHLIPKPPQALPPATPGAVLVPVTSTPAGSPFFFTHIEPRRKGVPARLSGFLTGIRVLDPEAGTPEREFNDLERRLQDLQVVLNPRFCRPPFIFFELLRRPLRMEH